MPFVLDASVTMSWAFQDEATAYTTAVFARLQTDRAEVPTVWPLEVANVLVLGERRRRISPPDVARFVQTLRSLPIDIENQRGLTLAFGPVLDLARAHGLSAYDASYLELADRRGLPLATQDTRLQAAAVAIGVPLVQAPASQP